MEKKLGVLCHVSSIPSEYGIGDFGKSSREFIDFLSRNNFKIWQILPLNVTNEYNCPYSSTCCYSIDEMYVDPEELLNEGKIERKDLKLLKKVSKTKKVDFDVVKKEKRRLLEKAYLKMDANTKIDLEKEIKKSSWLYEYSCFRAILETYNTDNFRNVPKEYLETNTKEYKKFVKENEALIFKYAYFQYLVNKQWKKVREYAHGKSVNILGDLPIYPDQNSFDVYLNRNQFKLDKETLKPLVTGGVPADEFCEDGQNWGTCVYDWDYMKSLNYNFMISKTDELLKKYDILRLDHFLGYVEHYEWDAKNPKKGKWYKKGGEEFFKVLEKNFDMNKIVIEDLGLYKRSATAVRKEFNLKGMCVLQMILENKNNIRYAPSKVEKNCLYYLGTHDNNTFIGYLKSLNKGDRKKFCSLVGIKDTNAKKMHIECIKKMVESQSEIVILQIQDYLMQDEKYRMNVPGQAAGCWEYKMPKKYEKRVKALLNIIQC